MAQTARFILIYDRNVINHLRSIERKHHSMIRRTIEEQLRSEPDIATTNRKPLEQPASTEALWELRFGPRNRFRVFYQVIADRNEVRILAIGEKIRNRLMVSGEEFDL